MKRVYEVEQPLINTTVSQYQTAHYLIEDLERENSHLTAFQNARLRQWAEMVLSDMGRNAAFVLATGAGKTVIFSSIVKAFGLLDDEHKSKRKVLILLPGDTIAQQTKDEILKRSSDLKSRLVILGESSTQKDYKNIIKSNDVIIMSYAMFRLRLDAKDIKFRNVACIIADEAHEMVRSVSQKLLNKLAKYQVSIIPVTATPRYNLKNKGEFDSVYQLAGYKEDGSDNPISEFTINDAIEANSNAPVKTTVYELGDIGLNRNAGEVREADLSKRLNKPKYHILLSNIYMHAKDPDTGYPMRGVKALIFCAGIAHANALSTHFNQINIDLIDPDKSRRYKYALNAVAYHAIEQCVLTLSNDDIEKIKQRALQELVLSEAVSSKAKNKLPAALKKYNLGGTLILCGADILTRGFNDIEVELILNPRMTRSDVINVQRSGRGQRICILNAEKITQDNFMEKVARDFELLSSIVHLDVSINTKFEMLKDARLGNLSKWTHHNKINYVIDFSAKGVTKLKNFAQVLGGNRVGNFERAHQFHATLPVIDLPAYGAVDPVAFNTTLWSNKYQLEFSDVAKRIKRAKEGLASAKAMQKEDLVTIILAISELSAQFQEVVGSVIGISKSARAVQAGVRDEVEQPLRVNRPTKSPNSEGSGEIDDLVFNMDHVVAQVKSAMKKMKSLMHEDEGKDRRSPTSVSSTSNNIKRDKTAGEKFRSLKTALTNMIAKLEKIGSMKEQLSRSTIAFSIKEELIDLLKEFEEIAVLLNELAPIVISKKDAQPVATEEVDGMEVDVAPTTTAASSSSASSSSSSSSAKTYADLDKLSEDYLKELDAAYNTDKYRNHNPNVDKVNQKCVLHLQDYAVDDLYKKYQQWNSLVLADSDNRITYYFFNSALLSQCCQKVLVNAANADFDVTKYDFSMFYHRGSITSGLSAVRGLARDYIKKWFQAAAIPDEDKERFRFLYNTIASIRHCVSSLYFDETWRNLRDMKAKLRLDVAFPIAALSQHENEKKMRTSNRQKSSYVRFDL